VLPKSRIMEAPKQRKEVKSNNGEKKKKKKEK
jgi:hypothetical protein